MSDKPKTILLIDDDKVHLESTRDILADEGYIVRTHDKPFGTTNLVRDLSPDLVLLDVNMSGLSIGDDPALVVWALSGPRSWLVAFGLPGRSASLYAKLTSHRRSILRRRCRS